MGLLSRILGRKPGPVTTLEEAIERLQIGITTNLITHYSTQLKLKPTEAVLLANCVLSYAIAMDPIGEPAQQYQKKHSEFVRKQALELAALADVAQPLSYLYAAITLLLAIRTRNPFSELSSQLGARATELSLYIPNTYDICGTGDAAGCIQEINDFSVNYQRSLTML